MKDGLYERGAAAPLIVINHTTRRRYVMKFTFDARYARRLHDGIYGVGLYLGHDEDNGLAYIYDLDGGRLCALKLSGLSHEPNEYRAIEVADCEKAWEVCGMALCDTLGAEACNIAQDAWMELQDELEEQEVSNG